MKRLLIILICGITLFFADSRTIRDFFASEPDDIFMLVPHTARLDMLDYYDSGQKVEMSNKLGTGTKLDSLDNNYIKLHTSESRTVELLMLQYSQRDTIIAVIETVFTPVPDSRLRFFNSNWVELSSIRPMKKMPTLDDFFLSTADKAKRSELLEKLPFSMLEMTFTSHNTLVVRHNLDKFLSKQEFAQFKPYLREKLTYNINGAKFTLTK